jgi:hypothetical protein
MAFPYGGLIHYFLLRNVAFEKMQIIFLENNEIVNSFVTLNKNNIILQNNFIILGG